MMKSVIVEPVSHDFVLSRCLHRGPLSRKSLSEAPSTDSAACLEEITRTYGACAIIARDGDMVVGMLRFYPKAICNVVDDFVGLCVQGSPCGVHAFVADKGLPPFDKIQDKTLTVHCLMTGTPFRKDNPYQRKGLGSRMVQELVRWGREAGWHAVEARAVEDLGVLYEHTGQAGKRFWEKLGFRVMATEKRERAGLPGPVMKTVREQAAAQGLDPDVAEVWTMRTDLGTASAG